MLLFFQKSVKRAKIHQLVFFTKVEEVEEGAGMVDWVLLKGLIKVHLVKRKIGEPNREA